jgi:hypothetical protein
LEAGRGQEADFFGDGTGEEAGAGGGGFTVAGEGEWGERRRLKGRETSSGRVVDGVAGHAAGRIVICAQGFG